MFCPDAAFVFDMASDDGTTIWNMVCCFCYAELIMFPYNDAASNVCSVFPIQQVSTDANTLFSPLPILTLVFFIMLLPDDHDRHTAGRITRGCCFVSKSYDAQSIITSTKTVAKLGAKAENTVLDLTSVYSWGKQTSKNDETHKGINNNNNEMPTSQASITDQRMACRNGYRSLSLACN